YFFLLAEAMQQAGEGQGLPAEDAAALARQTLIGAGRLVEAEATELAELRARVTSKGGTTAAALESFEASEFRTLVDRAMAAAATRSRELAGAGPAH
ncbi:MAG: pyrroline-5-carboxylate reductase, partial [Sinobacteraceae bacterium]|nr:pyrroline-5-carboxylate reductase [Nevskiaceae bacterium]